MKKLLLLFASTCIVNASTAGQLRDDLSDLLKRYTEDSTIVYGFQESKGTYKIDKLISFQDIRVGTPVELFFIDIKKLELLSDTEAVEKFIKPKKEWEVPIWVKDKCIYTIFVCDRGQYWELCGSSSCYPSPDGFDRLRETWPENGKMQPVFIQYGNYSMLHFLMLNKHNLLFPIGDLDSIKFPTDNSKPSDSREVISGLKKYQQARKEYWKKNPTFAPPAVLEDANQKGGTNEK